MARGTDLTKRPARPAPAKSATPRRLPPAADKVSRYLRDIRAEMNRVTWPSRQELIASTIVVLVVLVLTALYLGGWDAIFTWLFQRALPR
jgi:preprotein translocase subunit SecE